MPFGIRRAGRNAAARRRHASAPRDRAVRDRELPPASSPEARPQHVLPRVVESSAAGRLSGRDRLRDGGHAGPGGERRDPGPGRCLRQHWGAPSQGLSAQVETRYASQVHSNSRSASSRLFLNTRVAPFDCLDVRRALNYAADRAAAVGSPAGQTSRNRRARSFLPTSGLPALLPVRGGSRTPTAVEGAGSREGACARRPLGHTRDEGHVLGLRADKRHKRPWLTDSQAA